MNILFICDEYPPGKNGGIGTATQILGRELVSQGHKVFVAGLYTYYYGQSDYEVDHGVRIWRLRYGINLGKERNIVLYKIANKLPGFIKRHLNGRGAFRKFKEFLSRLIEDEGIDVMEVPDFNTFALNIGFFVKWPKFNVPLILKSHGSFTYFARELNTPGNALYHKIDSELYSRADYYSAVSEYTANRNRSIFNITREIRVLYNCIGQPPTKNNVSRKQGKVIFTGTIDAKKGIFQLMKAWNKVVAQRPEARLIVFGKGKIRKAMSYLDESARETVEFRGHVPRAVLLDELSSANMAVFPSYSECFALAPIEAMSVACPVIFTKRASGPELIHDGLDGFLVEPDDVNEICEKMLKLMDERELQKKFSEHGQALVFKEFTISKSAVDHVSFYTEAIRDFKLKIEGNAQ